MVKKLIEFKVQFFLKLIFFIFFLNIFFAFFLLFFYTGFCFLFKSSVQRIPKNIIKSLYFTELCIPQAYQTCTSIIGKHASHQPWKLLGGQDTGIPGLSKPGWQPSSL